MTFMLFSDGVRSRNDTFYIEAWKGILHCIGTPRCNISVSQWTDQFLSRLILAQAVRRNYENPSQGCEMIADRI